MRIRAGMLAAGAAALISAQAAYAAPATVPTIDPLVSLSVFGTAQSRAAVCAAGSAAATAGAAVAAAQAAPPGCLLPITGQTTPAVGATMPPPVVTTGPGKGVGALPLVFGLLALLGLGAFLFLGEDDELDPEPVSPF